MPGWQGSTRKSRLPSDWPQIRKRILARDGGRCTWIIDGARCPMPATDVDHIIAGDNHDDSNLRSLCKSHHAKKSSAEGGRARRRQNRYRIERPNEQHPGLRPQGKT